MFPTSEDMVSDFHKSAYGYRPHEPFWNEWRSADDAEKQVIWDAIHAAHKRAIEAAKRQKAEALAVWKVKLRECINELYTRDQQLRLRGTRQIRETALLSLTAHETFDDAQDVQHWVWKQGILFTDPGQKVYFDLCDLYFGHGEIEELQLTDCSMLRKDVKWY